MSESQTKKKIINNNHIARNLVRAYVSYFGKKVVQKEVNKTMKKRKEIPGVRNFIKLCENEQFEKFLKEQHYKIVFDRNGRIKMFLVDTEYKIFIQRFINNN